MKMPMSKLMRFGKSSSAFHTLRHTFINEDHILFYRDMPWFYRVIDLIRIVHFPTYVLKDRFAKNRTIWTK